jgi:hypothetical protein
MTPRLPSTRCLGPDCPICYRDYEALYPAIYRENRERLERQAVENEMICLIKESPK